MTLPTRPLGKHQVSTISLGCMNLSHAYPPCPTAEQATELLNAALDLGITYFDTAALYGFGANERLLAGAIGGRRSEYVLASKCVLGETNGRRGLDGSPAAITASIDASLERLKTDHIDLLYLHRLDRNVPIEESVGALVRAKEAGKIGALGLSEMSADTVRRAQAVHPIVALQTEYSPLSRNPEVAVLETCRELGIAFVAFSPLARGLLTGGIRSDAYAEGDLRRGFPRYVGDNLRHNLGLVDAFAALATELGCTSAQLSLAWVLSRGDHVIAIPGTTSIAHLEENVAAARIKLDADTSARIDALFAPGRIRGARYNKATRAEIDTELMPDEDLTDA